MKLLHTSDWHVGKAIRGHSRADEHRAVLAEITNVATDHAVDVVVVAGDLFETAAPTAEAEEIVYRALLGLAETGAQVMVISGNHDNARRLAAVAPLLELGRISLVTEPRRPDDGGLVQLIAGDGAPVNLALLPFVSQRGIVRADQLMAQAGFQHAQDYANRLGLLLDVLCEPFGDESVNVLVGHVFVAGGAAGGGERMAHLVDEYQVPAQLLPVTANYVALGHLHRPQKISGPGAIHYCGSPLQLDFGEQEQQKVVNIVEMEPGLPARVTAVPLHAGRALRTLTGPVATLAEATVDDRDWLRVVVQEPARAGLADEIRGLLGSGVVDVRVDHPRSPTRRNRRHRRGRTPIELFGEYLTHRGIDDPRVAHLFGELLDDTAGLVDGSGGEGP